MISRIAYLSLLVFASSTFGAAIFRRDDGCSNFSPTGISNYSTPFSLWAQYEGSGVELPLAMSTFSTSAPLSPAFLAPTNYAGGTTGTLFQLNNSGLVGIGYPDGNDQTSTWISGITESGGPLPFTLSPTGSLAGINENYCEVPSTSQEDPSPGPLLAAEGTVADWSICNRTDNPLQMGLVLQAATYSSDYGYNFSTCQSVIVFLRSFALGND